MDESITTLWYSPVLPVGEVLSHLSEAERNNLAAHPQQRAQQATAWAMRRQVLAQRMGQGDLVIQRDERGRPFLAEGPQFSTAHTPGMAVVARREEGALGVDVEALHRSSKARAIAARFLAPDEQVWLQEQPDYERAFIELWVLKEAMVKAQGLGLAGQLKRFTIRDDQLTQLPKAWGSSEHWHLQRVTIPGGFCVGLASAAPCTLQIERWRA